MRLPRHPAVAYLYLVRLASDAKGHNHHIDARCTAFACACQPQSNGRPVRPFIGLLVEAVLIAVILGSKGFDPIRFFFSWGVVTVATFMMLVGCFLLFDHLASPMAQLNYGFLLLIVVEAGIVWIEAIALQRMTRIKFFLRRDVAPLRFGQALGYSLLVNVVSFLFGL